MSWIVLFYIIYLGVPLALLLFFGLYCPKLAPLTPLICPFVIFLIFHREFFYYQSRGMALLITAVHTVLVAIPAFIIRAKAKSKEDS